MIGNKIKNTIRQHPFTKQSRPHCSSYLIWTFLMCDCSQIEQVSCHFISVLFFTELNKRGRDCEIIIIFGDSIHSHKYSTYIMGYLRKQSWVMRWFWVNILLHKRKIAFKINSKIEVELKESQYWYHKELSFMNHEQSKAYPQVFRG